VEALNYDLPPLVYCREFLNSPMSSYKIGPQNKELLIGALNMIMIALIVLNKLKLHMLNSLMEL